MVRTVARDAKSGPLSTKTSDELQELLGASTGRAHEGRVYDYYLGGTANYAIDREFASEQIRLVPELPWAARQNRKCLGRMVQYMLSQGIRQFVDIGSGLPTTGNVHQVCEQYAPGETNVIYVDHDPIASAHALLLLERAGHLDRHFPLTADLRDHNEMWEAILNTGLVDLNEPIGLLLLAVLHFIPDNPEALAAMENVREVAAPGSFLALSHASADDTSLDSVMKNYGKTTSKAGTRTPAEITRFFGDWSLADPGVVWTAEWTGPGVEEEEIAGDMNPSNSKIRAGLAKKLD